MSNNRSTSIRFATNSKDAQPSAVAYDAPLHRFMGFCSMQFGISIAFTDPADYTLLAQAAEDCGFSAVTLPDHLIYPRQMSVPYPYTPDGVPRFTPQDPFLDPWLGAVAMAAVTKRLWFYTSVYVLPARNPVHVAKQLASAACLSGDRVALGVGVGWMPEEFSCAGQPFVARGRRTDEMLEVLQKLWSGDWVEHHGEFYDFDQLCMSPVPARPIPVYVGGFSEAAMRRAARHDGWIADLHSLAELESLIARMQGFRREIGREQLPFRVLGFGCTDVRDASGFRAMRDMGVDVVSTMPWAMYGVGLQAPVEEKIRGLQRFADEVIARL